MREETANDKLKGLKPTMWAVDVDNGAQGNPEGCARSRVDAAT